MTQRLLFSLMLCTFLAVPVFPDSTTSLSGTVKDKETLQPLIGANVMVEDSNIGTTTDADGRFRFNVPAEKITVIVSYIGYKKFRKEIDPAAQKSIECLLTRQVLSGEEIAVTAQRPIPEVSTFDIKPAEIRSMSAPTPDVLQTIKTLPGVTSASDQTSFYHVRGGSYDENLLYINGFEINQLHIVRKGYLENPSLIHPNLVSNINLRTGGFPVTYGDKLSSVLDISYQKNADRPLSGLIDLRTTGLTASMHVHPNEKFYMNLGLRKINYAFILGSMQSQGDYRPDFEDVQVSMAYTPMEKLKFEILALNAKSRFDFTPESWEFRSYFSGIYTIDYEDSFEAFNFQSQLLGLKTIYNMNHRLTWTWSNSVFQQQEKENSNLAGILDYEQHPHLGDDSAYAALSERADNSFRGKYWRSRLTGDVLLTDKLVLNAGADVNVFQLKDRFTEYEYMTDPDNQVVVNPRAHANQWDGYVLGQFAQLHYQFKNMLLQAGLRTNYAQLNGEVNLMPRLLFRYDLSPSSFLAFTAGRYTQPPIYREYARTDLPKDLLLAQKLNNFTIGYEGSPKDNTSLKVELYYKKYDDLISYDINDVKVTYSGKNDAVGYAYGMDVYVRWQPSERMNNWISYSYLVAQQDIFGDDLGYIPMSSERRHHVAFYTEENMERFENSKIHIRLVYGSGYPYTSYAYRYNPDTGLREPSITLRNANRMQFYMRFDIGMTQQFFIGKRFSIMLREEILNVFNHFNVIGYSTTPWNDRIKHSLSGRTYNLGLEVGF